MKNKLILLLACLTLMSINVSGQHSKLWLTYAHSKFVASPGLEYAYFFNSGFGLYSGLGCSYEYPNNDNQLVEITDGTQFSLLHDIHIGVAYDLFTHGDHNVGVMTGLKAYMGTMYKELYYYPEGDYSIYYDAYNTVAHFGVDIGVCYSYQRYSCLLKYDTAFNKLRVGVGYCFGDI